MKIAFFDFDGTISSRDSFLHFLLFTDKPQFLTTCATHLPQICLYLAGHYPNQKLKESFLQRMFAGQKNELIQTHARTYCTEKIPALIRQGFWDKLAWHRQKHHRIVVVTATPRIILEPWCLQHSLEILGTELETDANDRLTGKIAGRNCMGEEKVRRIRKSYQLTKDATVYAYGDSAGDLPMLDLAAPENRFFKPFR